MTQPLVCCICLTADRPAMAKRAVRSFLAQGYPNKHLMILDSGSVSFGGTECGSGDDRNITHARADQFRGVSVGALRNIANTLSPGADLIAHWDDDDWSHPQRLAEQVALIESDPTLDAVGYSDMLFWADDNPFNKPQRIATLVTVPEAWLYTSTSSYLLGTSLLYRRAAWERKPFEHVSQGEDKPIRWLNWMKSKGASSLPVFKDAKERSANPCQPRMIASIHGANTSSRIDPASENFRRVPEWDAHCRSIMSLGA